ncbi:MAG: ABC transporter ATP-binding protein [Acidobacteria bacterium]|nr:ABC transporter ATP-binding protein [Acidobacteriota bacterium]
MGANVAVEGVSRGYGAGASRVVALEDVSFTLAPGSFTALLGPSGCGKSTLLHLLGALDRPDAGRVLVAGRDLARFSPGEEDLYRRRTVATVFQFFNLLPTMNALENVRLPLLLDGASVAKADARAKEALLEVGLEGRERSFPYELSGGQMQRVAIARALSGSPELLLADEPTGNLDSKTGGQVLELVARLHRERGLTVVMATHAAEAAAVATSVLRLRDGRLEPRAS